MELINQTLIMAFLGIIAASCVTFPIIYLVQKRKQHKELISVLKEKAHYEMNPITWTLMCTQFSGHVKIYYIKNYAMDANLYKTGGIHFVFFCILLLL